MQVRCGTHYITNCSASPYFAADGRSSNASGTGGGGGGANASNSTPAQLTSRLLLPSADGGLDLKPIELYAIGVLIVFGLFGNVASIVVLRRYRERRDALFLLQALAVADILYLLAAGLRYPLKYVLEPGDDADPYVEMQPTVFPLLKTFQTVTIWMMVLVTVDRYCCVCRPLEAPRCFNWSARRRYAVVVFLAAFVYNAPRYVDSCVVRWVDPCGEFVSSIDRMLYRQTFANPLYYDIYIDGLYLLLLYVGPLTTLIFMNVRLVQAIRQSRRRLNMRTSRTSNGRTTWSPSIDALHSPTTPPNSDKNATVVLIIIVVVFVVCETPELILKLVTFTERNFPYGLYYSNHMLRLNVASELLLVVNSSANFIVYVAFGRRFRRILRETFRFSFRFSASATALTRDDAPPHPAGAVLLAQQRLQYHHNCVHVHKMNAGVQALHRGGGPRDRNGLPVPGMVAPVV